MAGSVNLVFFKDDVCRNKLEQFKSLVTGKIIHCYNTWNSGDTLNPLYWLLTVQMHDRITKKITVIKEEINQMQFWWLPEAQGKTMSCILIMVQHMFVDKTAAQDIFTDQAQPVFSRVMTSARTNAHKWR